MVALEMGELRKQFSTEQQKMWQKTAVKDRLLSKMSCRRATKPEVEQKP